MEEYEYVSTLGEGAYGHVWKCLQRATGQVVAIKSFKEAHTVPAVKRLALREVRMLRGLNHPAVVPLLDAFQTRSGRVYMVFPYVGQSGFQALDDHPYGLPPQQLKLLTWQLLQALVYMHGKKVIHRDIKPANVLISEAGDAMLCDFGFARKSECEPREAQPLSPYVITRWYRPPEVLLGQDYGPAADIWSLGCTVAELATGLPLFQGNSTFDQLMRIMRCFGSLPASQYAHLAANPALEPLLRAPLGGRTLRQRLPSRCEPSLLAFLQACLQPDPARRCTAAELLQMPYFWIVPRLIQGSHLEQVYGRKPESVAVANATAAAAKAGPQAPAPVAPTAAPQLPPQRRSRQQPAAISQEPQLPEGPSVATNLTAEQPKMVASAESADATSVALGNVSSVRGHVLVSAIAVGTAAAAEPIRAAAGEPQQPPQRRPEEVDVPVCHALLAASAASPPQKEAQETAPASDAGTSRSNQSPGGMSAATGQSTRSMPTASPLQPSRSPALPFVGPCGKTSRPDTSGPHKACADSCTTVGRRAASSGDAVGHPTTDPYDNPCNGPAAAGRFAGCRASSVAAVPSSCWLTSTETPKPTAPATLSPPGRPSSPEMDTAPDSMLDYALLSTCDSTAAKAVGSSCLAHCDTVAFELRASTPSAALARLRAGPPAPRRDADGSGAATAAPFARQDTSVKGTVGANASCVQYCSESGAYGSGVASAVLMLDSSAHGEGEGDFAMARNCYLAADRHVSRHRMLTTAGAEAATAHEGDRLTSSEGARPQPAAPHCHLSQPGWALNVNEHNGPKLLAQHRAATSFDPARRATYSSVTATGSGCYAGYGQEASRGANPALATGLQRRAGTGSTGCLGSLANTAEVGAARPVAMVAATGGLLSGASSSAASGANSGVSCSCAMAGYGAFPAASVTSSCRGSGGDASVAACGATQPSMQRRLSRFSSMQPPQGDLSAPAASAACSAAAATTYAVQHPGGCDGHLQGLSASCGAGNVDANAEGELAQGGGTQPAVSSGAFLVTASAFLSPVALTPAEASRKATGNVIEVSAVPSVVASAGRGAVGMRALGAAGANHGSGAAVHARERKEGKAKKKSAMRRAMRAIKNVFGSSAH